MTRHRDHEKDTKTMTKAATEAVLSQSMIESHLLCGGSSNEKREGCGAGFDMLYLVQALSSSGIPLVRSTTNKDKDVDTSVPISGYLHNLSLNIPDDSECS
jgi:hypothetical protein